MGLRGLGLSDSGNRQMSGSYGHGNKPRNVGNFLTEDAEA